MPRGEEIVRATRIVAAGDSYLDPSVTSRVLDVFRASAPQEVGARQRRDLTAREVEVLRLIGQGLSNEEIANQLVIGEATVKTHISRIFDKLDVRDRAAAIVLAFDQGLVTPGMARGVARSSRRIRSECACLKAARQAGGSAVPTRSTVFDSPVASHRIIPKVGSVCHWVHL